MGSCVGSYHDPIELAKFSDLLGKHDVLQIKCTLQFYGNEFLISEN